MKTSNHRHLTRLLAAFISVFSTLAVAGPVYQMHVPVITLQVQSTATAPGSTSTATAQPTPTPAASLSVSTSSLSFSTQTLNTPSAAQNVLVTNTGNATASFGAPTTTGPFSAATNCNGTLNAGWSCTVSVTFTPTVEGAANGVLTVGSGSITQTVALAGVGQGTRVLGFSGVTGNATTLTAAVNASTSQLITVQNTGTGVVTLGADATLATGSNTAFTLSGNTCSNGKTLAPNATCQFTVNFAPTSASTVSGSVQLASNADAGNLTLSLQGTGYQTDPYYANVALLTHLDGSDGGTTFTSQKGPNLVSGGSPNVAYTSTASPKFGTASVRLPTGSYLTTAMTAGLNLGAHMDWTLEFFFKADSLAAGSVMMSGFYNSNVRWTVEPSGTQGIMVLSDNNTATQYTTAQVMATGTWYHLAVERQNGNVRVFVNGLEATPKGNTAFNLSNVAGGTFSLGRMGTNSYFFTGNLDDVRVTPDVARYSGAFTPPAQAFPNQ